MCFFFSLLPATVWLTISFFILLASTRATGGLQTFGRVLGTWALVIALFFPMMGGYVTETGACPIGGMMETMHAPQSP